MQKPISTQKGAHCNDATSLSALLAVLARVFSYPSAEEARCLADPESIQYCSELLRSIGLEPPDFLAAPQDSLRLAFLDENANPDKCQTQTTSLRTPAQELRLEMSRLFYSPLCPIRLEGRYWVPKSERNERSASVGERASVSLEYAAHGIRLKRRSGTSEDSLENELDFVSLLARREAIALLDGNASEALHCKESRHRFHTMHMKEFIAGVASAVPRETSNPFLVYYAQMLALASMRIAE